MEKLRENGQERRGRNDGAPSGSLARFVVGGWCYNNHKMAEVMILPEVLNRKSLFSLLYQIDQDLAERTKAQGCPFAGVRCIAPIMSASLGAGPRILKRLLRFALACAVAVCCRYRFGFGIGGFPGRRCYCGAVPCVRDKTQLSPWSDSKGYGVQRSSAGNATFKTFLPRAPATGACPVT